MSARNERPRLNDSERAMWVQNDEALYSWHRASRMSVRAFIRTNRAEIDAFILRVLSVPPRPSGGY